MARHDRVTLSERSLFARWRSVQSCTNPVQQMTTRTPAFQGTNKLLMSSRSDRSAILELFRRPQPAYARHDVMRLLGLSESEFEQQLADLALAAELNDRGNEVFRWEDVASLAWSQWTPRMIHAALGHAVIDVIPHLNQHRLIQVSLPIYLIRYLDYATRQASSGIRQNASDILERVLHEHVAGADQQVLDREIPGILRALQYPYFIPRPGNIALRCRYCDISITDAGREVCKACIARHEPREHLGEYGIPELEEPHEPPAGEGPATRTQRRRSSREGGND